MGEAGHVTRSSAQVSQEETLSGEPSGSGSERRVGSGPERTWIFCHTQHPAALHPLLPSTLLGSMPFFPLVFFLLFSFGVQSGSVIKSLIAGIKSPANLFTT